MRLGIRLLASVLVLTMYLPVAVVQALSDAITVSFQNGSEVAGVPDTLTVTASASGVTDPLYTGTVHFTSSDGSASLPADYIFVPGDAGTHDFTNGVTFHTSGNQSVTADDGSLNGTVNTTVSAAAAATVNVTGSTGPLASGAMRLVTAIVKDAFGNLVSGESVTFTQSFGSGTISGLTPGTTDGSGVATDTVTGALAGAVVVTAAASSGSGTLSFTVVQGALNHITVTPRTASIAPGGSQAYVTTSFDAAGNTANVSGTATLGITPDGGCTEPTCTASIGGAHTVTSTYLTKTDTATLTVGNNPPVAVDDSGTVLENAASTLFNVLANDIDADSDPLTVTAVSNPPHGTATFTSASVHYQPEANYSGADSFTYDISDGNGGTSTATVNVTVTWVNQTPSFNKGGNQSVSENAGAQSVSGWATAISPGPGNGDVGQTVHFNITDITNSALFSVLPAVSAGRTLTYTPATNASGSATITLDIQDNGGTANSGDDTSNTQTFTITVTGVNQPPSFTKGANASALEDSGANTVSGWAIHMDAGAPNESGQALDFIVTNNNNALFTGGGQPDVDPISGDLTYTPALNANGVATVSVILHDNGGTAGGGVNVSPTQTFTITVTAVNDAPTFTDPADQTVLEDAGAQVAVGLALPISPGAPNEVGQVLTFAMSNDNNALFTVLGQPTLDPTTGNLTYTPAPDANGSAVVTARLNDGGGTAGGGVDHTIHSFTINVTAVNDAPSFTKGANQILAEEPSPAVHTVIHWATGFSPGPVNEASQTLLGYTLTNDHTALFSAQPAIDLSGNLTYTLAANRNGVAIVSVTVQDSGGTSPGVDTSTQTFTLTVTGVDHPPAAVNDFPTIVQGSGPTKIDVLANDIDPDGDPMTITSVSQGTSGHVAIAADHKSLTYDPNGSFIGTDQFVYTVSDGRGGLAFGTVRVSVVKDTFAPVATTAVAWILGGSINTTASIALTWHGSDVGFGVKTYQLQESRNNAAWAFVTLAVGASSTHRVVTVGSYYQYRIRAIDLVGNIGPWTYLHLTPTLYQESAATYSGAWTSLRMVGALGGRVEYATTHGPVAVFTCTCRSMSWIGPKGALGSARVYIDGVLQGIFSEHSATTLAHQGIFAKTWGGAPALHEMDISAKGDGKLEIDGFLTLQ